MSGTDNGAGQQVGQYAPVLPVQHLGSNNFILSGIESHGMPAILAIARQVAVHLGMNRCRASASASRLANARN